MHWRAVAGGAFLCQASDGWLGSHTPCRIVKPVSRSRRNSLRHGSLLLTSAEPRLASVLGRSTCRFSAGAPTSLARGDRPARACPPLGRDASRVAEMEKPGTSSFPSPNGAAGLLWASSRTPYSPRIDLAVLRDDASNRSRSRPTESSPSRALDAWSGEPGRARRHAVMLPVRMATATPMAQEPSNCRENLPADFLPRTPSLPRGEHNRTASTERKMMQRLPVRVLLTIL